MKKLFYGLGAVAAVVTPVVAVVSCGSKHNSEYSGKVEALAQVFKDAKLDASKAQLAEFTAKFGDKAEYEFEAVTDSGATGAVVNRHLVLIRHETRLTLEQAKKQAADLATSWNAAHANDQLGGTDSTYPVKATTFKGIALTNDELKDKGFAYTFNTNDNGHIRVRAIVEDANGNLVEYDKPVFAIDLTPIH